MELTKITFQHGNDFAGIIKCEHCGHEQKLDTGYHDDYYHSVVIPGICCEKCDKNRAGRKTGKGPLSSISKEDL